MENDDHTTPGPAPAEQGMLPLEGAVEDPIPFELTARARRVVAPATLPDLTVLPDPLVGEPDARSDTRPARARALRRSGLDLAAIAAELELDVEAVRAWCGTVRPARVRATVHRAGAGRRATPDRVSGAGSAERDEALTVTHRRARDVARRRMASDPAFARDATLVAGVADLERHGIAVRTDDRRLAAAALAALRRWASVDDTRVRVVLRVPADVAADILVHRWAGALGLPTERVAHTRERAGGVGGPCATLRVAGAHVAATVSGWRQAALDAAVGPAEQRAPLPGPPDGVDTPVGGA